MRGPVAATIHEFEDCRYSVERCAEAPEYAILSFSHPYELSAAAREYASETYAGIAKLDTPAQNSYQMSLKVNFPLAGQDSMMSSLFQSMQSASAITPKIQSRQL